MDGGMQFGYIPLQTAKMLQLNPVEIFCMNHFLFPPKEEVTFMK